MSEVDAVRNDQPVGDHMLQWLVQLANDGGYQIPITLNVSSGLLTGTLISGQAFWEDWKSKMMPGVPAEHVPVIAESFDGVISDYDLDREVSESEQAPIYIHLKDAKFVQGSEYSPISGTYWRGRISSVDGYFFGSLGRQKSV